MSLAARADNFTLSGGAALIGDIVKFDDNGVMLRTGETYTNVPWAQFSQESLKQLSANVKIKPLVEPFIEPDPKEHAAKAEIKINPVHRLDRPAHPSIFGGLLSSSVGLFILIILYAANLYAAFEIAVVRARPIGQVIGLSAVLPIIGPAIFFALPMLVEAPPEEIVDPTAPAATLGLPQQAQEIQIAEASWREQKKNEPQVFARGKFTFNKRFIETKFAAFTGAATGEDAKKFMMTVKAAQQQFTVERIANVGAAEILFETVERGQITVPMADIQEIILTPRPA